MYEELEIVDLKYILKTLKKKKINKHNWTISIKILKNLINIPNSNWNYLITPCKSPAYSNTTIHPNTIIIITDIECLQVLKKKKVINKQNWTIPSKFTKFNKHSQYQLKLG